MMDLSWGLEYHPLASNTINENFPKLILIPNFYSSYLTH